MKNQPTVILSSALPAPPAAFLAGTKAALVPPRPVPLKEVTDIKFSRRWDCTGVSHGSLYSERMPDGSGRFVLYQFYSCSIPDPGNKRRRLSSKHCVVFGAKAGKPFRRGASSELAFMAAPLAGKDRTIARAIITAKHKLQDTLKEMNAERGPDDRPITWFPFLFW